MIRTREWAWWGWVVGCALAMPRVAPAQDAPPKAAYQLTLREAVQRGLERNIRVRSAAARMEEAEGTRERRLAALLPRARTESFANLQNRNLRAFGISLPGAPAVVGPFSNFDFRVSAEQALFDLPSYRQWKASRRQEQALREDYQDVRDSVVRQVAAIYLSAQAAAARARAAAARVQTAEELDRLARERREAGVATGVDVLRAQVRLAQEQQRLLEARNASQQLLLLLARTIGLSPGTPLELAEPLAFQSLDAVTVAEALTAALAHRWDYLSLATQRQALAEQLRATRARFLPKVAVGGNYGGLGRSLGELRGTGILQGTISLVLYDRDREGERRETESRIRRVDDQLADLRLGIEQEIREALLTLESAAQEVGVAEQGERLALRELELARDRFQAGVASNIEVVAAQDSVARTQENSILAVTRHTDARMALARALGATEKNYERYLGGR